MNKEIYRQLGLSDPVLSLGEAAENELPDASVSVSAHIENGSIFLHIHNTCTKQTLQYRNGLPSTTKVDEHSHGFGLHSVRDIVSERDLSSIVAIATSVLMSICPPFAASVSRGRSSGLRPLCRVSVSNADILKSGG